MKTTRRLIQFRTQPETGKKEDNRSRVGKIASALGGAAVIGGAGYLITKKFKAKEAAHLASRAEQTAAREVKQAKKIFRVSEKAVDTGKASPMSAKPYAPTSSPQSTGKYSDGGFNYGVKAEAPAAKPAPTVKAPATSSSKEKSKLAAGWVKAPKATAPEQTVQIRADRKPAPSAPSAPFNAKNIAASNAVEAAHKAKIKAKIKAKVQGGLGLSTLHQKMINFQERRSDNRFGTEINPLSAYRKASRIVPWVNRASEAAGDVGDIASGKKVKDPFYKKSWFKRAAQTAAVSVGVAGLHLRNRSIERHNDGRLTDGTADKVGAWLARKTGGLEQMSAKPNKLIVALAAHKRLVEFAGLLPKGEFKTSTGKFKLPAKLKLPEQPGAIVGADSHPDHLSRIPNVNEQIKDSFGDLAARRASGGGTVALAPNSGKPTATLLRGPAGNAERSTLRHELVHAIHQQRRGGSPKSVSDMLKEEVAAYSKQDSKLRGLPSGKVEKALRSIGGVRGVVGSTQVGMKNYKIPAWKLFQSKTGKRIEFATVDPLEKGWDLRDARGRSARVYAPGSKKRNRREKDWGEKTDNIRAVRNAAIVTAVGLGGLAIHQGLKQRKAPTAGDLANATKAGKAAGVAQQRNAWKTARKRGVEIVAPNDAFKKIKPRSPANAPVAMSARQVMVEFARRAREDEPAAQKVSRWVVPTATTLAAGATIAAALTTRKTAAAAQKSAEAATAAATRANQVIAQNETSVKNVLKDAAKTSRNAKVITGAVANPIRRVRASAYIWKKRIGLETQGKPIQFSKGASIGAVAGGLSGAIAGVYSAARSGRKVSAEDDLRGVIVSRPFAKKAYLPASHTGIGLPNGNIAHVVRAKGKARGEGKYRVVEESFDKFAGGATVKARDGVAPKAALRARQAVGTEGGCYSTLGKNCEHVTDSIKTGRKEGVSKQVERGLAAAAVGAAVGGVTGHLIQRKSK